MLKVRELAEENIMWLVGREEINMAKDKWLVTNVPVIQLNEKVHILFHPDGNPIDDLIKRHLGTEALNEINNSGICLNANDDQCIWTLNNSGKFTLTSA